MRKITHLGIILVLASAFLCNGFAASPAIGQEPAPVSGESGLTNPATEVKLAETPEAEPAASAEPSIAPDEADQAENIAGKFPYELQKNKDPFKPVVEKKPPVIIRPDLPDEGKKPEIQKPIVVPVPPLKLSVQGIVGNEGERLAMVFFENELIVVKKDQDIKGKFKMVDILSDKVVVYSNKEQLRRTFSLGGKE